MFLQSYSAEIIIIIANFIVLTANIMLIKLNPTFQLLAEVLLLSMFLRSFLYKFHYIATFNKNTTLFYQSVPGHSLADQITCVYMPV